jgi:hypothetical protein
LKNSLLAVFRFHSPAGLDYWPSDRVYSTTERGVAQLDSALRLGRRGRRFKSGHPDRLRPPWDFLGRFWFSGWRIHPPVCRLSFVEGKCGALASLTQTRIASKSGAPILFRVE